MVAAMGLIGVLLIALGCSKSTEPKPKPNSTATRSYTYEVAALYPHDSLAFTQGLVYGPDGKMYEGTGLYGSSSLRRVDLATGNIEQMKSLSSSYFGEGIAIVGDRIYQLTWLEQTGFVWNIDSFDSLGSLTYQTEGWGLTFDGERLIMSDGSSFLWFRDTANFTLMDSIQVVDSEGPVHSLNELEYINGQVWANIWYDERIARINPATGWVDGYVEMSGLLPAAYYTGPSVLNGIAYDSVGNRIFVTGKYWPKLFEIDVVEVK